MVFFIVKIYKQTVVCLVQLILEDVCRLFYQVRIGREVVIDGEEFKNLEEDSGGEIVFTDYIRPVCLPCTGTCVTPDDIRDENGNKLLTGNETPQEACIIESKKFVYVKLTFIFYIFLAMFFVFLLMTFFTMKPFQCLHKVRW